MYDNIILCICISTSRTRDLTRPLNTTLYYSNAGVLSEPPPIVLSIKTYKCRCVGNFISKSKKISVFKRVV